MRAAIETAAQDVLDPRAQFPDATLADLYDPLIMSPALVKAHAALDKAVDAAYIAAEKPPVASARNSTPNASPSCSSATKPWPPCCLRRRSRAAGRLLCERDT